MKPTGQDNKFENVHNFCELRDATGPMCACVVKHKVLFN